MAYTINQNDIVQVSVKYQQIQVQDMYNILHYRYTGTNPIADGAQGILRLLQAFDATIGGGGWSGAWADIASNSTSIDEYIGQRIYPLRMQRVTWDVTIPGTVAIQPLPGLNQWGIVKRGEVAARYAVGGLRIPGLPDTYETGGEIAAVNRPLADTLAALVPLVIEPDPGNTWEPVVLRRLTPGVSERVTSARARYLISTQRTRISFRGV